MAQLQPYQKEEITHQIRPILRIAVLAIGLLLLCRNIDSPFIGWHEDNSALNSNFARNHVYYGLGYTKLFNIWADTQPPPANPHLYLNHPPLLSLWAAIPMYIFGDHEWVCRLVPIAATLGSVWLLMVIVSRLQSPLLGLLTGCSDCFLLLLSYQLLNLTGELLHHLSKLLGLLLRVLTRLLHLLQLLATQPEFLRNTASLNDLI